MPAAIRAIKFLPSAAALHSSGKCAVTALTGLGFALIALLVACSANDPDSHPADVLARFLESMDRTAHDDAALKDAFVLLDENSQRELTARAQRTSSLAGRNFAPWDMIAQGRFRMRFTPAEHSEMRAAVTGEHALVHVKSDVGREANVPMVREHGRWRIKLDLPAVAFNSGPGGRTP